MGYLRNPIFDAFCTMHQTIKYFQKQKFLLISFSWKLFFNQNWKQMIEFQFFCWNLVVTDWYAYWITMIYLSDIIQTLSNYREHLSIATDLHMSSYRHNFHWLQVSISSTFYLWIFCMNVCSKPNSKQEKLLKRLLYIKNVLVKCWWNWHQ